MNLKKVSIIIPCRNEKEYIKNCVLSILENQSTSYDLEVLVCDGMSDDGTQEILVQLSQQYANVIYLKNVNLYTPHALNLGIQNAKGDYIGIFGAHALMKAEYIKMALELFEKNDEIACLGGVLKNIYLNKTSQSIGTAMSLPLGVGNAYFRTGNFEGFVDTVAFGIYRKEVFETIGVFDEKLIRNQDDEFNYRMIKNGYKIYLSQKMKADYVVRSSYKKLFNQYFQYGYWKVYVNKIHKSITTFRQVVPLCWVLYLLLFPIVIFSNTLFLAWLSGICLYILLLIGTALYEQIKNKNDGLSVAFTICILHFSYGFGYLKGIVDFFIFNKNKELHIGSTR